MSTSFAPSSSRVDLNPVRLKTLVACVCPACQQHIRELRPSTDPGHFEMGRYCTTCAMNRAYAVAP